MKVIAQPNHIRTHADELVSHFRQAGQRFGIPHGSGKLMVLSRSFRHQPSRLINPGIIKTQRRTDTLAKIGRAKKQHIHTFNLRDLFQFSQGFGVFDLQDDKALLIGLRHVAFTWKAAERTIGIAAIQWPPPDWMKARLANDVRGVRQAHHMRDHNAGCIQFQWTDQIAVTSARHTDNRVHIMHFRGSNHVFNNEQCCRCVLLNQPNAIEAAQPRYFCNPWVDKIQFDAFYDFASA